jgi:hypothetical protein
VTFHKFALVILALNRRCLELEGKARGETGQLLNVAERPGGRCSPKQFFESKADNVCLDGWITIRVSSRKPRRSAINKLRQVMVGTALTKVDPG